MKPRKPLPEQDDLLRRRLVEMIDMRHELVKLEALLDWEVFEREWLGFFPSHTGRPATSPRLVAGLLYLQHAYALSDEAVVARWAENPYWQHFCGETFFQHRLPIDPSSMTRWRQRIGEEGVEWMLTQTIEAGKCAGVVNRLLAQKPKDKKKLYSLHEPAVDCISKGKAHKRYEFGTKVSVATTNRGGFVIGMRALPGNPYDGHTLNEALEQVEILTDQKPEFAFVDRGYRGHGVENVKVFISGAKRGVTRTIAKLLRRRSAIEPMIGHMKNDGRLTRSTLKGTEGDAIFAVLCGCGHNIRMILRYLRTVLRRIIWMIQHACMIVDPKMAFAQRDHVHKLAA